MRERKTAAVNVTKERVVVLVKLRITLRGHTGMTHDHVHTVRNVDLHFPSGNRALVNPQTAIKVVRDTGRIRTAHLTLAC